MTFSDIPTWPEMRQRYVDFWEHKRPTDRPVLHVQVPPAAESAPPPPAGDRWLQPENLNRRQESFQTTWTFLADLFPLRNPSIGPNSLGAYVGAKPHHDGYTLWLEPTLDDWADVGRVDFTPDNPCWQGTLRYIDYLIEHYGGRVMLGQVDFGGPLDVVGALRGSHRMCLDVADRPDDVRALADRVADIWKRLYDTQLERVMPYADGGSCVCLPLWGPGRVGIVQDDLGVLVSADDYRRCALPAIRTMLAHVDLGVYHFHSAAVHLLDLLVETPEIDAIEFGIDPNTPSALECIDHLIRIQQAGKGLFVWGKPEEVKPLLEALDPTSLVLLVRCETVAEAKALIPKVERWTRGTRG